jgi:DNA primase
MTEPAAHRIDRDNLLARVDLVAVLDALSPGDGHGSRRQWRCPSPTHDDNHPSVKVSTDSSGTQRWRCWSGGEGGTAIDAVMEAKSMSVGDAIRWLNDNYAHLEVLPRRPAPEPRPIGRPAAEAVEYAQRCEKLLWSRSGRPVRDWLNDRGLGDDVLRANRVGADPGRRILPRVKGLPGGWPAAVFPALDRSGTIAYFQARFLQPPDGRGKYDNPSRKWASNPRVAWTQTPTTVSPHDGLLIVTEGIPDALIAAQAGFSAVAVLGSMYPDARVADAVASYAQAHAVDVAVCFDCDPSESGAKGASRLVELLGDRSVRSVVNVVPPDGMDLSDWAAIDHGWIAGFDEIATPVIDSLMELSIKDAGSDLSLGS